MIWLLKLVQKEQRATQRYLKAFNSRQGIKYEMPQLAASEIAHLGTFPGTTISYNEYNRLVVEGMANSTTTTSSYGGLLGKGLSGLFGGSL